MCIEICCLFSYYSIKFIKVVFYFTIDFICKIYKSLCINHKHNHEASRSDSIMESNVVYCTYKIINQYEVESETESECETSKLLYDKKSENLNVDPIYLNHSLKDPLMYNSVLNEHRIMDEIM